MSELEAGGVANWTRENVDRANVLLPAHPDVRVLTLPESFMQCRLRLRYECYQSQRACQLMRIPVLYQRFAAVPCDTSPTLKLKNLLTI